MLFSHVFSHRLLALNWNAFFPLFKQSMFFPQAAHVIEWGTFSLSPNQGTFFPQIVSDWDTFFPYATATYSQLAQICISQRKLDTDVITKNIWILGKRVSTTYAIYVAVEMDTSPK